MTKTHVAYTSLPSEEDVEPEPDFQYAGENLYDSDENLASIDTGNSHLAFHVPQHNSTSGTGDDDVGLINLDGPNERPYKEPSWLVHITSIPCMYISMISYCIQLFCYSLA